MISYSHQRKLKTVKLTNDIAGKKEEKAVYPTDNISLDCNRDMQSGSDVWSCVYYTVAVHAARQSQDTRVKHPDGERERERKKRSCIDLMQQQHTDTRTHL